jgi:hypothetical protein
MTLSARQSLGTSLSITLSRRGPPFGTWVGLRSQDRFLVPGPDFGLLTRAWGRTCPCGTILRIYDDRYGRRLVAAIELISPSNKDRPESRRAFVGKVAALLQRGVCVSLVDVVTIRDFNLYGKWCQIILFWNKMI